MNTRINIVLVALTVRGAFGELLSASDKYVNFGATLIEVFAATRHVDKITKEFNYQGPLPFDVELAVERVKIAYAGNLRKSFRLWNPEYDENCPKSLEEEMMVLPFPISADIAKVLKEEGYTLLQTSSGINDANLDQIRESESGRALLVPSGERQLVEFPITCDPVTNQCTTDWVCWGVSLALDGLSMEETCNLVEKIKGVGGGSWTINDWLREIPGFMDAMRNLESIGGVIQMQSCGKAADHFSRYSHYGQDAVFYYPKAMCEGLLPVRGCLSTILILVAVVQTETISKFIPDDVMDIIDKINTLLGELFTFLPNMCYYLKEVGLLGDGSIMNFLSKWETLFEPANEASSQTKLELLLKVLKTLTGMSFIKDYLPTIPDGCENPLASAAQGIYKALFESDNKESVPTTICSTLGQSAVSSCIIGLTKNIDEVDWIAASLGNGHLHELGEVVLPSLCQAVTDVQGLTVDDLFSELPMLLRVYQKLDLQLLSGVLPGVHDVMVECGDEFAKTVEVTEQALKDGVNGILKLACSSRVSKNHCLAKLSDGLDQLTFASDLFGHGTLRIVVDDTLPTACEITSRIYNFEEGSGSIDMGTIVEQLPDIIKWYASLTKIDVLKKYVPVWPEETCSAVDIDNISQELAQGVRDPKLLPDKLCILNGHAAKQCLLAFGDAFEANDFVKKLFESEIASSGPKATFEVLLNDIIPPLCESVSGTSIDMGDMIRSIPAILQGYKALDVVPLRKAMPEVHEFLTDEECAPEMDSLVLWIADIIQGVDSNTVGKICTRISHNKCLVKLSRALDKVEFIRNLAGVGTLELIVDTILPSVCNSVITASGNFDTNALIEKLPDMLLLVDKLTSVTNGETGSSSAYPLQAYIPKLPQDEVCRLGFQDMAKTFVAFTQQTDFSFSSLTHEMCVNWDQKGYYGCLVRVGDALDDVELIVGLLGGKGVLQGVVNVLVPAACEILTPSSELLDEQGAKGVIQSIPLIIDWYKNLQPSLPEFIKKYTPIFPSEECNDRVIGQVRTHLYRAADGPVEVGEILDILCNGLSNEEKKCFIAVGDSIDNVPALLSVVGMKKGFLQMVVGEGLDQACSIVIGEFDQVHLSNIALKIPELLRFMTSIRETMPSFLSAYLPVIPHEACDTSYNRTAKRFSDDLAKDGLNCLPGVFCDMTEEEVECISKLGDSMDDITIIENLVGKRGLIRLVMSEIRDVACEVFKDLPHFKLSSLDTTVPKAIDILDKLNSYPMLAPLVPDIPASCPSVAQKLTSGLANLPQDSDVPIFLCSSLDVDTRACIGDLGQSLEQVQWIAGMVPETHSMTLNLLSLLPLFCSLLYETGEADLTPDAILQYLPLLVSLLEQLRDVMFVQPYIPEIDDNCMNELQSMADGFARGGLEGTPGVLCGLGVSGRQCIKDVGSSVASMSVYQPMLPDDAENTINMLVDSIPTACKALGNVDQFQLDALIGNVDSLVAWVNELNAIPAITRYIPDISPKCTNVYTTSLAPRFKQYQVVTAACGITLAEEKCLRELIDEILSIPMIAGLVHSQLALADGKDAVGVVNSIVDLVFEHLPGACATFKTLTSGVSVATAADNILLQIPTWLDLIVDLRELEILNAYVPAIDTACVDEYKGLVGPASDIIKEDNPLLLPGEICKLVNGQAVGNCLIALGGEIESLSYIPQSMRIKDLTELFVKYVLPATCEIIQSVIVDGEISFAGVFDEIPQVAALYTKIQTNLPDSLKSFLPAFPEKDCSNEVLEEISENIKHAMDPGDSGLDIPTFICSNISSAEKQCFVSLGDVLDEVAFVRDILGRPGILQSLVGDLVEGVCSLLGDGSDLSLTTMLGHIDTMLHLVDRAHNLAPDVVRVFLPEVPGGECKTTGFPKLSAKLGTTSESSLYPNIYGFSVGNICLLNSMEIECLGKLGDNIEKTPALRSLIYGSQPVASKSILRNFCEAIPTIVCGAFNELGELPFDNILAQLPKAVDFIATLNDYPVLDSFVPKIPAVCKAGINTLVTDLRSDKNPLDIVCNLNEEVTLCALEFGKSLESTPFTAERVPGAHSLVETSFKILPPVCSIFQGESFQPDGILKFLPDIMLLFQTLDKIALANKLYDVDIGDTCRKELTDMMNDLSKMGGISRLPNEMCAANFEAFECMRKMGNNVETLPFVSTAIPEGLISDVVVLFRDDFCPIYGQIETMEYHDFLAAVPNVMNLLGKLGHVDLLADYLPKISGECRDMFGGAIATKMADGLRHAQKHGFFSLGDSLDFSGTTSILCEFNEEEKICFNEVAKAITEIDAVKAFIDDGMPLKENSNRKYTLDEMVSVGLSLKDEVCVFLEDLGNLTFTNIVLNSARAIRIVDKLNAFPVIGPLVPTFGDECVQAATNVASYAVGDNSIEKICGISESESRCLIDIGRKLDGITFVQMMFESLTTTTYTTIQASIEDILLKALPGACGLMDDIGLGMERNSISGFMGKIPEFLKSLEIFSELPILKSFAPKLSESCNKTLSSFAKNVANAKGELQGVMQVCIHYKAHGDGVPNCLLEMNDKFEAVEFIGEHIPDGIVKAFVDSVPIGCDLLNQDAAADRTAFLGDDLPVLLRAVGFLAGVEETCREQVVSKAKDSKLCEVDETCMENYIDASMSIPLVGRFVPSWTRDLVIDLCAVKNGGATMKEFINTHLGNIMGKIAEIPGIDSQCKDAVKIAANITGVDRFKQICLKLGEYDCTLQTVAALSQLPVAKDVIPPGTDKLIQVSCGYLTDTSGTATVFDLVPHLAPLMQVLGLFLGYPSDTCGEQLIAVTEKLSQVEKFDTGIFCSGLSSVCTSEVVQSFSGLPMVGGYLPKGSDQLIGASCALYKDRNDYATSMDHLSTLFDLLGKLVDGPYLQLDKGCKEKIKLHLFDRDNEFQPKMLCEIGVCKTQLIDALQRLPLAGEYVPDSAIELLNDMCSIQERSGAKGALLLTEDLEDKRGLPRTLPEILAIFGRLVSSKAAEGSGRRLDEVKCGKKLTEYGESQEAFTIESFCSEIPEECMPIVLESLEKIPLLKQFIPERTGELITTSCALKRANGNVRTLIRDSLPSLLAIVISPAVIQNMKTLDGVCKSPLHEVGALFKSKGGIVCGRELCAGVEQACIESFAESLQGLTFAGNYVPDDLVYALKNTCKLIRSAPEFKGYYEDTRADMFHMTSLLASGFAPSCVQPLAVATTSNDLCKNSKCVDDFVSSLDSAVLIGKHLPDWVKPMYSNICAATGRSPETFPVFVNNTLPQAFSVAGGVFEHNTACTYQVKSFGKSCGTTGIVPLERLCHMQASCFTELKKTLGTLPLWGTLIPGNTMSYLDTICTIFQDTARGELTETSKVSKFLQGGLVQILKELIQLQSSGVITEEHCIPSYSAAVDKIDTESICKTIPIDCLRSFIGFSRDYTIYDQYVPKDFDVLVLNICPISNAEDPVNYILSNKLIPDLAFQLETFSTGRAVCDAKKTISDMCADETCVGDFVNAFANLPLLNGTLSDQQKANLTTQLKTRNCVVDQGSQDSGTMPPTNVTKAAKATSTVVIVGSVIGSIAALTLILVLVKLYLSTRKGKDDESRLDLDQALSVVPNMNSAPITHLTSEDARAVEPDSESSDEDESPFGAGGGHTATIRNN